MAQRTKKVEKTYTYVEFRKTFLLNNSIPGVSEEKTKKYLADRLARETIKQFKDLVSHCN